MTTSNSNTDTSTLNDVELKLPEYYSLIIHNDDSTSLEFVMLVLNQICLKSKNDSEQIAITAHNHGSAIVGTYTENKARHLKDKCMGIAKEYGYEEFKVTIIKEN